MTLFLVQLSSYIVALWIAFMYRRIIIKYFSFASTILVCTHQLQQRHFTMKQHSTCLYIHTNKYEKHLDYLVVATKMTQLLNLRESPMCPSVSLRVSNSLKNVPWSWPHLIFLSDYFLFWAKHHALSYADRLYAIFFMFYIIFSASILYILYFM